MICDYGCGREAKFPFKNGKWCCSKSYRQCPSQREKTSIQIKEIWENPDSIYNSILHKKKISKSLKGRKTGPCSKETKIKIRKSMKGKNTGPLSKEHKKKISKSLKGKPLTKEHKKKIGQSNKGKIISIEQRIKISKTLKFSITDYKIKHPFFSKIEKMRYNPDKSGEKEIQVHCKNHNCKNSKEKGGWFTPTRSQIGERIRHLENKDGTDGSYLYCSQKCKDTCSLYNIYGDPYRDTGKAYTPGEKEVFNEHILKRDDEICYFCGEHANTVHHLRPQKLEPFFALDPDYAISVCMDCHYKYCHPAGSEYSTGNLAKIVCSVESQKFLNQK